MFGDGASRLSRTRKNENSVEKYKNESLIQMDRAVAATWVRELGGRRLREDDG